MTNPEQPGEGRADEPHRDSQETRAPAGENAAGDPTDVPPRELKPEDQARVDGFLKRGVNSVERKPFKPILLMVLLIVVVAALSLLSQLIARIAGVV